MDPHSKIFIEPGKVKKTLLIGKGRFGNVYSGTYARDDGSEPLKAALKTIRVDPHITDVDSENIVQILQRASAECDHVCRFYGVTHLDGFPCTVMKLYQKSLQAEFSVASDGRLALKTVIRRGTDICKGLQELHSIGIIMRHLMPNNVLVGEDGNAVLSDFGLAKAINVRSASKRGWATTYYMAPEMVQDDGHSITPKADIWALGCILLKAASGTVWPAELSEMQILGRIFDRQAPTVPEGIPPPLADVIRHCLHAQPEQRPSAAEVQQVLEDLDCSAKVEVEDANVGSSSGNIPQANSDGTEAIGMVERVVWLCDQQSCDFLRHCGACPSPKAIIRFLQKTKEWVNNEYSISVRSRIYLCYTAMAARGDLLCDESLQNEADFLLQDDHISVILKGITRHHFTTPALATLLCMVFTSSSPTELHNWCYSMRADHMGALVKAIRAQVIRMLGMEGMAEEKQVAEPGTMNEMGERVQWKPSHKFELPHVEKSSPWGTADELALVRETCSTLMEVIRKLFSICPHDLRTESRGIIQTATKRTSFAEAGGYPVILACLYGHDATVLSKAVEALRAAIGEDDKDVSSRLSCLKETLKLSPEAERLLKGIQTSSWGSETAKAWSQHLLGLLVDEATIRVP